MPPIMKYGLLYIILSKKLQIHGNSLADLWKWFNEGRMNVHEEAKVVFYCQRRFDKENGWENSPG